MASLITTLLLVAAVQADAPPLPPTGDRCAATPLYAGGDTTATVCAQDPGGGITVLDLGDG